MCFIFPKVLYFYKKYISENIIEKMTRISVKKFLSQIQPLRIKMTKIALNVLSKEINIHLYPNGKLIQTLGFRVKGWDLGFRVQGLELRGGVQGLGFRVKGWGVGFRVQGLGLRFRVQGLGFRVQVLGFRVEEWSFGIRFQILKNKKKLNLSKDKMLFWLFQSLKAIFVT